MCTNKLKKQIENFSTLASLISPLCQKYNNNFIKPFLNAAQVYKENYRSSTEFLNLIRFHKNLMHGSIGICNSLFENYEELKQKAVYEWSWYFFNALHGAKKVLDEAYNLAYTVGRDDIVTKTLIENETNPLVQIQRKVILDDTDYDVYKKTMFDWKCNIQALYVEEQYMKHVVELCNSRKSKFNPREAKINKCTLRKTITIPDRDYESTPQICVLNAELIVQKTKIDLHEKNEKLTTEDIDNYIYIYSQYQRELIAFVFTNFSTLYNETCVQCIKVFLEQQHSIIFNLLQKRKILAVKIAEKIIEDKRIDKITWNDIDKVTSYSNNVCENGSNSNSCNNKVKVVGSLT